jgi:hypothetical protein
MHGIGDDVIAVVVGLADRDAVFDTTARHPHGEAARVMVASVIRYHRPPSTW